MTAGLSPKVAGLLLVPPLMWAGNAVVGRLAAGHVPPLALNAMRWALAALILLHVAAALKHHFLDRDGLLGRMWPARTRTGAPS